MLLAIVEVEQRMLPQNQINFPMPAHSQFCIIAPLLIRPHVGKVVCCNLSNFQTHAIISISSYLTMSWLKHFMFAMEIRERLRVQKHEIFLPLFWLANILTKNSAAIRLFYLRYALKVKVPQLDPVKAVLSYHLAKQTRIMCICAIMVDLLWTEGLLVMYLKSYISDLFCYNLCFVSFLP